MNFAVEQHSTVQIIMTYDNEIRYVVGIANAWNFSTTIIPKNHDSVHFLFTISNVT